MTAKFMTLTLEQLQQQVDGLIYRLLTFNEESLNIADLCEELEEFAGRDYIVYTKLTASEMQLTQYDREYLSNILTERDNNK